ncbi:MAG: DMT family transporter [Paracoccaceae bacterium]
MPAPQAHPAPQLRLTAPAWGLILLLALIWGGSFLSNRAALAEVGVLTTVAFRVSGASVVLWLYVLVRGLPVPLTRRALAGFAAMGLFNNVIPFSLIVWGQQHIPSGLASILNASTALFGVILVAAVFPDERLTRAKGLGVALGFAGVAMSVGAGNLLAFDPGSLGQIAVLGAALAYAVAGVAGRILLSGVRPEVAAAGMLTAATAIVVPLALCLEGVPTLSYSLTTWAALVYLALLASALAYILYYAILRIAGAGYLSLVTLLIPPVAILLGALVYGEALGPGAYAGFAILAAGLAVLDGRLLAMRHPKTVRREDSA